MRFGDEKNETYDTGTRDTDVRVAFNSPFRPFVLTTTSIGQEGLDFHQYCHRVVHWNLPSNPVDLEQREGRVHRYKGHVVRRNLAEHYGLKPVVLESHQLIDAWEQLFECARKARLKSDNDLVPYWVYEKGKYKIERMIPVLPLSREIYRLEQLKKSLVTYRSVIGQPRQQELLEALNSQQIIDELQNNNGDILINLSPPSEDISL
jgi:superfamily II DNA/RNA helicase